ncbi:MAG: TPM domain-containing protein [Acidobacteriota bacterium]
MKLPFNNRRAVVFVALLAIVWVLSMAAGRGANAQGPRLPKPTGHVNDFAEVVDTATRQRLETVLGNLKQRTGIDFVIATVKSAGNEEMIDYSAEVAKDWNIGAPTSADKSLLMVIASDKGKFFVQFSQTARADLPDGLIGEMGRQMSAKIGSSGYGPGLVAGVQTFVNGVGAQKDFTFASLDQQAGQDLIAQTRPRVVEGPAAQTTETPAAQPSPTATPQEVSSPTPAATETPAAQPTPTATAEASPSASPTVTGSPQPSETVPPSTPSPSIIEPTVTPVETASATPMASPAAQPSPSISAETGNAARPTTSPASTGPTSPEDEKEQVEVTLGLPLEKRIEALTTFIATHPKSVALPRANELIIVARAMLGDQKLQAGDVDGGLEQFRLAVSGAPTDMTDRLFIEVIARIPMNLFVRGQRAAALDAAHQAEALAKLNPNRVLAVTQFFLAIEDANEANRLAELAVQLAPDSPPAHQALGAARHIALRLDEAESEYARALALDPKSAAAKLALADLKRAAGKNDEALALYRELLQANPKSNSARAGVVLSLLELGKKEEAEQELTTALQDKERASNLPLLVGTAYWLLAHNDPARGLELAQKAVTLEPRYSWGQIAMARALLANRRPMEAERALRFVRQFSRFPTLDYELANVLASMGLYDEAAQELAHSFSLKDGQIETKLAGRNVARAASFTELLALERRAAIFQPNPADTDANAKMLKALLGFTTAMDQPAANEDELTTMAKDFVAGDDAMRTYRQVYVAGRFLRKGVALSTAVDLTDQATSGVEAALSVAAATVAVQPDEYADIRARALATGATPNIPEAPRSALSGILRGRMEDIAGMALFNLDKPAEAATRLRRAVSVSPEGTPLWRSALWHLGSALEASGKNDQALLYYIKSYVAGAPDPARRTVIENVYKKVNGTLEGLDDKIGPGFATATAPTPSPSPTPQ